MKKRLLFSFSLDPDRLIAGLLEPQLGQMLGQVIFMEEKSLIYQYIS
jgi:hypothetical protein